MLATILFLALWVVLALGLVFIALRGGVRGAREALQSQSPGGRKTIGVISAILYLGFGIAIPIAFLTGNHAKASSQVGGIKLTAAEKEGRVLFGETCAVCHTLSAASATGKVGPNLDQLKPPYQLVLNTINHGCAQNPPPGSSQACLGQGNMPAQLYQGRQAQDVAQFVAKVAGRE